jgi:hypothetical protein
MPIIDDRFLLLIQNYMECKPADKSEMLQGMEVGLILSEYFVKCDRQVSDMLVRYLRNDMNDSVIMADHLTIILEIIGVKSGIIAFNLEKLDLKKVYVPSFINGILQVYLLVLDSRDNARKLYNSGYTVSLMVEYFDVIRDIIEGMRIRLPVRLMV